MIDGTGLLEDDARQIGNDLFSHGALTALSGAEGLPGSFAEINTNAWFDAARRLSQCIRILNRLQFVRYAVNGGKSILWFRRYSVYDIGIDLFSGIADAIASVAPEHGLTNEWLLSVSLKPYHPSDSSVWKAPSFSDYWSLFDRCTFYDLDIYNDDDWLWHVAYGQGVPGGGNILSENPTGYRYGKLSSGDTYINQQDCAGDPACEANRLAFYKSCRIYEPPCEIESAVTETDGGLELVKVTLTGRLHNTYGEVDGAPATVDEDITTWDAATIQAEPYRTDENALRLYLICDQVGTNSTAIVGDNSLKSDVQSLADNPYASIYPHFHFTKLIPEAYDDGNDTQSAVDTPLWHDVAPLMELYLRCMCEGYVDEVSTTELADCAWVDPDPATAFESGEECAVGTDDLYDYTFSALCLQAFSGQWITTLPTVSTDYIHAIDVRDDAPQGFGPLPNTITAAEQYNQLASAVDLLTRVRLMMPWKMEERHTDYQDTVEIAPAAGSVDCGNSGCGATGTFSWSGTGTPATTVIVPTTAWADVAAFIDGYTGCGFTPPACGDDDANAWKLSTTRRISEYRFALTDPDLVNALPAAWSDMVAEYAGTLACIQDYTIRVVYAGAGTTVCGGGLIGCDLDDAITNTGRCAFISGGSIDTGPTAPESWYYVRIAGWAITCSGSSGRYQWITPLFSRSLFLGIPLA